MTSGIQLTPHLLNLPSPIDRDTSKTPRTRPSLKNIRTKSGKNKVRFYWFLPVAGPSSFLKIIWQRRSVFFFDSLTKKILTISLADCPCGSTPSGKKKKNFRRWELWDNLCQSYLPSGSSVKIPNSDFFLFFLFSWNRLSFLVRRPIFAFYLTVPPAFWILILSSYYKEITFKWSTKVFLGDKNKWFCHHSAYLSNDPCGTVRVVPWKTILKADMCRAARVDESPSIKSCPALYEHGFFVKTPRKNENSKKKKSFLMNCDFLVLTRKKQWKSHFL